MEVKKLDKSNMRKDILEFPKQFQVGLKSAENVKAAGSFDAATVCGMGGSALPADIVKMWLEAYRIALPLHIHRNYGLPLQTDQNHLVICVSYSGNTEETLSAFKEARSKGLKMAAIASGGKLMRLCKKYKIPLAAIPKGYQPRMAVGFQFAALMKILANSGLIKNNFKNISDLEKQLKPKMLEVKGKKMAEKLTGSIPIVYASERFKNLAGIWKIKFNENTKIPSFSNYFPELNHNEHNQFDGFAAPNNAKLHVIILRDKADHPRIQKRMKLLQEMLKTRKVPVESIDITGKDVLYKIFSTILFGDWVSYYLALKYKIDPTPVKLNDEFKKKLN